MQALRRANRQHRIEQAADLLVGIDIGRSALPCREDVRRRNLRARLGARQMSGKGADGRQAPRPGWRSCLLGRPVEGELGGDDRRTLLLHVAHETRAHQSLTSQLVSDPDRKSTTSELQSLMRISY